MELLAAVTEDGLGVQVVLHGDEDEPDADDHAAHLVVEAEQRRVQQDPILFEILDDLFEDRKLILDIRRHPESVVSLKLTRIFTMKRSHNESTCCNSQEPS